MYSIYRLTDCHRMYLPQLHDVFLFRLCFSLVQFNGQYWKTLIQFQYARKNLNYRLHTREWKKNRIRRQKWWQFGQWRTWVCLPMIPMRLNWAFYALLCDAMPFNSTILYSVTNAALFSSGQKCVRKGSVPFHSTPSISIDIHYFVASFQPLWQPTLIRPGVPFFIFNSLKFL